MRANVRLTWSPQYLTGIILFLAGKIILPPNRDTFSSCAVIMSVSVQVINDKGYFPVKNIDHNRLSLSTFVFQRFYRLFTSPRGAGFPNICKKKKRISKYLYKNSSLDRISLSAFLVHTLKFFLCTYFFNIIKLNVGCWMLDVECWMLNMCPMIMSKV